MSGPNSAFTATSYALGEGIKQELDFNGKPKLSETNNLGNRIKRYGYEIIPMRCRVIKDRWRELFEIINNCEDSYFPEGFSENGRFNTIRMDETWLLDLACRSVPKETWEYYRYKMIYKVLRNFIFRPLAMGKMEYKEIQEIFTPEEINSFLSPYSSPLDFSSNQYYDFEVFKDFLSRIEVMLP